MPLQLTIDDEARLLRTTAVGGVAIDEVLRHIRAEAADGVLGYPELVDGRDASPTWTPREVREAVALLSDLAQDGPVGPAAIVVTSDFAYGMLRMLEILVADFASIRPFRDPAEAEAWLRETKPGPAA